MESYRIVNSFKIEFSYKEENYHADVDLLAFIDIPKCMVTFASISSEEKTIELIYNIQTKKWASLSLDEQPFIDAIGLQIIKHYTDESNFNSES